MLNSKAMQTDTCSLALGVLLGAMAVGLLLAGYYRQRDARNRIKKLAAEKKKTDEAMKKAKAERVAGQSQLPGAWLLILLGLATIVLMVYLLMGSPPP